MCIRGTCKLLRRILDLSLAFATHNFLQTIQNDCTCTSGTRQNFILQGSLCILISSRYLNKYELIRQKKKKKNKTKQLDRKGQFSTPTTLQDSGQDCFYRQTLWNQFTPLNFGAQLQNQKGDEVWNQILTASCVNFKWFALARRIGTFNIYK